MEYTILNLNTLFIYLNITLRILNISDKKTKFIKKNKLPKIWDYEFTLIHNCFINLRNIGLTIFLRCKNDLTYNFNDYDSCNLYVTDSIFVNEPLVHLTVFMVMEETYKIINSFKIVFYRKYIWMTLKFEFLKKIYPFGAGIFQFLKQKGF